MAAAVAGALIGCTSTYLITGEGGTPCATAVQQIESSQQARVIYGAWLSGYVTRYNYERESKLGREFDPNVLVEAAVQYCKSKPLDDFAQAAEAVVRELKRKG